MEADSNAPPELWDSSCFQSMVADLKEEKHALTHVIEADRFTIKRNAQHAHAPSSRHEACNDHSDTTNATKCQLASRCTFIEGENIKPTPLRVHEGVLMDDENQWEYLLHPCQAMAHQCRFNLTPMGYLDTNSKPGEPHMIVEHMETPFLFDGRNIFQCIRKPTAEKLENLSESEITAPVPCNPS